MPAGETTTSPVLVSGVHRVIRMLDDAEGPFAGALVGFGAGNAVRVDAASLEGWQGWAYGGAEHVAAPLDLMRRPDGHDALLPWCPERVAAYLGRRAAADAALGSGEICTLVASLLRGIEELGDVQDRRGDWWLTDQGRPVFVLGAGESALPSTLRLVSSVAEDCRDRVLRRVLGAVEEGLRSAEGMPRMPRRQLERWEGELLEAAAPRPLVRDVHAVQRVHDPERVHGPERVRTLDDGGGDAEHDVFRTRRSARAAAVSDRRSRERRVSPSVTGVIGALDEVRGAVVRWVVGHRGAYLRRFPDRAKDDRGAQGRSSRNRRRRKGGKTGLVIAAAAAAGVVLVGGLLWPSEPSASDSRAEDAERAVAEPLRGSHSETDVPQRAESGSATEDEAGDDAEPAPTPSGESTDAAEPVEAARDLLTAIRDCAAAGDRVCAEAVTGGAAGHIDEWGSMVQGTGWEDGVSLVDSYGDVAVLRLSSTSEGGDAEAVEPAQMIVLIRQNDKWLVRDVYAVADQPG